MALILLGISKPLGKILSILHYMKSDIRFFCLPILGGNQQDGGITTEILLVNDISNLGNWFTGI